MKKTASYQTAVYYVIVFYTVFFYRLYNGVLLCQLEPLFWVVRDDIFSFLFLQTGIPQWLVLHPAAYLVFDMVFYLTPAAFLAVVIVNKRSVPHAAFVMLVVNWLYIQTYTLYPTSSVTLYIAWLLFPVVFLVRNEVLFRLLLQGLRYFFLYFFFSAGIWKIVNGGMFNPLQMSAVLLEQHKDILAASGEWWMKEWMSWLVAHPEVSYTLYLLAACLELSFVVGFFSRRYDGLLAVLYVFFLIGDHLVMRIPYYETLPFLLTLSVQPVNVFSKKARFFQKA